MIAYIFEFIEHQKEELDVGSNKAFVEAMKKSPLSIPLLLIGVLTTIFLGLLIAYHIKLFFEGKTTHEDIKESGYKVSPFYKSSFWKNAYHMLVVPWYQPKFRPREEYKEPAIVYPIKKSRSQDLS